jgi:hypothetical protein
MNKNPAKKQTKKQNTAPRLGTAPKKPREMRGARCSDGFDRKIVLYTSELHTIQDVMRLAAWLPKAIEWRDYKEDE